jgi:hypothetical protein
MPRATRHLQLAGVKHLIARWTPTQRFLADADEWRLLVETNGWQLYELLTYDGRLVEVPRNRPLAVRVDNPGPAPDGVRREPGAAWKQAGLAWLDSTQALDQPFALLRSRQEPTAAFDAVLSSADYRTYLHALKQGGTPTPAPVSTRFGPRSVLYERVERGRIRFTTDAIGQPHIIKCTYFPNWRVHGADHIYMVTPHFMLVYPTQTEVELTYGETLVDAVGRGLTLLGAILAGLMRFYIRVGKAA